ncbi:MAG TPA: YciI family protein [Micromonosporaceae bacterium]|nr:YciI family protein [Micromonosporaceae bacterium]
MAETRPPERVETTMRYLLLIYGEESTAAPDPAEAEQIMNEYWAYSEALAAAGVMKAGEALQESNTATTVRVKDTERVVTDGPFAETREVLGGFYLVDVPDLDAALDWAARCPGAKHGSIEVRPIMEFDTSSA